jgi:hypothetical protein
MKYIADDYEEIGARLEEIKNTKLVKEVPKKVDGWTYDSEMLTLVRSTPPDEVAKEIVNVCPQNPPEEWINYDHVVWARSDPMKFVTKAEISENLTVTIDPTYYSTIKIGSLTIKTEYDPWRSGTSMVVGGDTIIYYHDRKR